VIHVSFPEVWHQNVAVNVVGKMQGALANEAGLVTLQQNSSFVSCQTSVEAVGVQDFFLNNRMRQLHIFKEVTSAK
jgi:hypothetical protein